jgi:hypothetical protein
MKGNAMSTIVMDYTEAHKFVDTTKVDVRWEGYSMVFFKPTHHGYTNPKGEYRNGKWGMRLVVPLSDDGTWKVPAKSLRHK